MKKAKRPSSLQDRTISDEITFLRAKGRSDGVIARGLWKTHGVMVDAGHLDSFITAGQAAAKPKKRKKAEKPAKRRRKKLDKIDESWASDFSDASEQLSDESDAAESILEGKKSKIRYGGPKTESKKHEKTAIFSPSEVIIPAPLAAEDELDAAAHQGQAAIHSAGEAALAAALVGSPAEALSIADELTELYHLTKSRAAEFRQEEMDSGDPNRLLNTTVRLGKDLLSEIAKIQDAVHGTQEVTAAITQAVTGEVGRRISLEHRATLNIKGLKPGKIWEHLQGIGIYAPQTAQELLGVAPAAAGEPVEDKKADGKYVNRDKL